MQLRIYFHIRSEKVRETLGLHNVARCLRYLLHHWGPRCHNSAAHLSLPAPHPLTQAVKAAFSRDIWAVFFL